MNSRSILTSTILLLATIMLFSSCSAVAGVFKAGVWVGVIGIAVVVFAILFFISKSRK